jgi:DNA-binding transcriptional MerR regulator
MMKPEYRSLDPAGVAGEIRESLASLAAAPMAPSVRTWTIGELARECDVTLRALRFYEGKGLLTPARRGGARLYESEDVRRLKIVLRLKRLGFSLVEIRDLMDRLTESDRSGGRLAALRARIEAQVAVLEDQRREIDRSLAAVAEEVAELERVLAV